LGDDNSVPRNLKIRLSKLIFIGLIDEVGIGTLPADAHVFPSAWSTTPGVIGIVVIGAAPSARQPRRRLQSTPSR